MTKIAIIHDWFVTPGGSEKVIEQLLNIFPSADIYCLFNLLGTTNHILNHDVKIFTSFLQKTPFLKKNNYRNLFPIMPFAIEQLDLEAYDIIISNCHAVSKGVISAPHQLHISYIHTPMRYAWDLQSTYTKNQNLLTRNLFRLITHYIRLWDFSAAQRPDMILANSHFIKRRIRKCYKRDSVVLFPPVDIDKFKVGNAIREDYYLSVSRLVPYKRIDLLVRAFARMPDKKLVVIGDGPDRYHLLKEIRNAPNVTYLGYQPDNVIVEHMQTCKAFLFAAKEDFGITPVEAQACGTPVIAYGDGGILATVIPLPNKNATGVFFANQTEQAIIDAVEIFEVNQRKIKQEKCRQNSEKFASSSFCRQFRLLVDNEWRAFNNRVDY